MSTRDKLSNDNQSNRKRFNTDEKIIGICIKVLAALAVLYTLYFAQTLLLPIIFSGLVALLFSPIVSHLKKYYIPRVLSAFLLLTLLVLPAVFLVDELAKPVEKWIKFAPEVSEHVSNQIEEISTTIMPEEGQQSSQQEKEDGFFANLFGSEEKETKKTDEENVVESTVKQQSMEVAMNFVSGAPILLAQILGSLFLIIFLLVFGPALFSVFITHFPIVSDAQKSSQLIENIQQALSKYIVTVSIINLCLGISTAALLWFFGIDDALLWGVLVALFNFIPYVGSIFSLSILMVVGAVQFGMTLEAFLPCIIFLSLNILESQLVTPTVLGARMKVNPLIVILWLLILGWLWGIVGVLVALPILVSIKLILIEANILPHWVKLIESREIEIE